MKLLAIETSQQGGSIAVMRDGTIEQRLIESARQQTEQILPLIGETLRGLRLELRELGAIVIGRGPGSFTGIRLAAAVAQGISLATRLGIVPVSSLAALAERARRLHGVSRSIVCVDARMGEVYWGVFDADERGVTVISPESLSQPISIRAPSGPDYALIGNGFSAYAADFAALIDAAAVIDAEILPHAEDLLPLAEPLVAAGKVIEPENVEQAYLRDASAWKRQQ
jgi:tRNA threonylcarbamoyladenosine biosynthesis protein TsaB